MNHIARGLLALLILLPACGGSGGGSGAFGCGPGAEEDPPQGYRSPRSVPEAVPGDRLSAAEIEAELDQAVDLTLGFWGCYFEPFFDEPWDPPAVYGAYSADDPAVCAGEALPPENAVYCPAGDFIAWDTDMFRAMDRIGGGDTAIYVVIAHEMGHAIQARLGIRNDDATVRTELQADCIAGGTLGRAVADGQLVLEAGDEEEILETIFEVADEENLPWGEPGKHGSGLQRGGQFQTGWEGGVGECF